jgi:hypothetical protein
MASKDAVKGYILEEVLAYLIRNAGYELIVDPEQDPSSLDWRGNGLVVIGRGSVHQVDVLGQLEWIPSFTFPIRLFAEAKFRSSTTGLNTVRNAVGTILDINQRYTSLIDESGHNVQFHPKFQYAYALFSTSGFTEPATTMALAHQISLIDLSGPEFERLRRVITDGVEQFGYQVRHEDLLGIRHYLRNNFNIIPPGLSFESAYAAQNRRTEEKDYNLGQIVKTTYEYGELFVGMANGPFMLLLKADNPENFLNYSTQYPSHDVRITWNPEINDGKTWEIRPIYAERPYRLTFSLPSLLAGWIFESSQESRARAIDIKKRFLSSISVYTKREGQDHLFRLNFRVDETLNEMKTRGGTWRTSSI